MSYYQFLWKKTIKSRAVTVPIFILLASVISLYIINLTTGSAFSYQSEASDYKSELDDLERYYQQLLSDEEIYSSEEIQSFTEAYQDVKEQSEWTGQALLSAEKENWSESLGYALKVPERQLAVNDQEGGALFPAEHVLALKEEIAVYHELGKLDQAPATPGYETIGLNFMFRVMDSLFPVLFVVILLVILTEVFLGSYRKGVSIERLLPMNMVRLSMKRLVFAIIFVNSLYVASLLLSLILGTFIDEPGSIAYPVVASTGDSPVIAPIWFVIAQTLTLQLLGLLLLVLLVALISIFIQNNLVNLVLSLLIAVGSPMVLKAVQGFHSIIHLNPFTYLAGGSVVTKALLQESNNLNVTFFNGVIVLSVFSILLLILLLFIIHKRDDIKLLSKSV